jgi:hypothetical protein
MTEANLGEILDNLNQLLPEASSEHGRKKAREYVKARYGVNGGDVNGTGPTYPKERGRR